MRRALRLPGVLLAVTLAALAVAGCSGGAGGATGPVGGTTVVGTTTRTLPPQSTVTVTAAPTSPSRASTSSAVSSAVPSTPSSATVAAPSTRLPAATTGDCPYLPADDIKFLTGQRPGQGSVIAVAPQPICVFTRSDGGWMAAVRVFRTPSAATAAAAVDSRVPVATSSPADQPTGWTGGYQQLPRGDAEYPQARSVYGVSRGQVAVVAWTNQTETVRARRVVLAVIERLGL